MTEIAPLLFKGGPPTDYEIIKASTGALMTKHIASNTVRLSVRSVEPLKSSVAIFGRLPGNYPGSAELLGKLPKTVAAAAAVTAVAAIAYVGYEAWRKRRENQPVRAQVVPLDRGADKHGEDLRAELRADEKIDDLWRGVSQAWDALQSTDTDRREPAEKLLFEAREFLIALAAEVDGDSRGQVTTAPYLYLARIAAAQALATQGERELAANEVRALHQALTEIGRGEFAALRLLDPRAHSQEVTMLWGLHAQSCELLRRVEDGTNDLTEPVISVPEAPVLAGIEDLVSSEGLALDLPIPVESVEELVAVRRIGADPSGPTGLRVPTVRSALISLGLDNAETLEGPIAKDVLMAVLTDEQGGMGAARDDFGLSHDLVYPEPTELAPVQLDWDAVIDRETEAAATEAASNRADDAAARLETLLLYLDGLVRRVRPDVYRYRVEGVRAALAEIRGAQGA